MKSQNVIKSVLGMTSKSTEGSGFQKFAGSLRKSMKGFSLIEVLIVIAIIAVLGSLFVGNVISAIARGRDSRRKQDLNCLL